MTVNIHDAKTHLSRLIARVQKGEEIVLGKAGKPVAKLVPYSESEGPRTPGAWRGRVRIAKDFDELPPEVASAFRGDRS
jgi:prevent-host-death family protein